MAGTAACGLTALMADGPMLPGIAAATAAALLLAACVAQLRGHGLLHGVRGRGPLATTPQEAIIALLSHDADVAYLTDGDGDIRYANPVALERFGDIADGHLASAFSRILANPEAVLFRLQNRALATGAAREDIITRSGQFRMSLVQLGDDTQLWRLDDLGKGSRNLGRAADQLTLPMLTAGPTDAILYLNEAFRKILGSRPKSLTDIFGPEPVASGQHRDFRTVSGLSTMMLGVVDGAAGRREVYLLPPPRPDTGRGGPPSLVAGWNAIEDLPVPLLKIAEDGVITASNREARSLLGLTTTQEKRVQDVLDGLGRPITDWVRESLNGQGGHGSQFLRGRGDNQETFVQVTLNTADGPEGRHLIAVLNDVTELKTLEAQFVQSQKMQAIGQLAGGVAHDFNNLLTAISGHCDLLLLRHDQGDHDYGDLIQIHQNANRAASLVGQLLAFSRKQNLQPERIDLRETLSDLTHLLNRLVGEKVSLVLDHDPDLAAIKADKRQLEQVMMNLVVNARDAMPQGGKIGIKTENRILHAPLARDHVIVPAGEYVVVRVVDEGCGIPADRLHKIFEPFWTTNRQGEGTGLGLSTVYGIVKQTGGYIFAQSEIGVGTEFELFFPSHSLPVTDRPLIVPPPQAEGDGVVLLVEDEAPVRAFASRALRLRGYTVLEADCAEGALELLSDPDLKVDIFVTDVIMPGKDGPTWVREALTVRPQTKVVFVSGYSEDAFADENERVPNSVFLPKPFSLSELTSTVHDQLN
ncbi:ATP-binding protein [Loktanella sp. DJP18]|uniref:ATP-binding protein n=1 Tax=Loktanella sp. DJP18 TaxID=3409788 RepID=UPI003BB5DA33